MRDYLLVLKSQVGMSWRRLGRGGRQAGLLLLGLAFEVGFGYFVTRGALSAFRYLATAGADYPELVAIVEHNLLVMWALFTVAIILSNALHTTYASLYQSEDAGFLLATPLNVRSVFAARLTGSMLGYIAVGVPLTYGPYLAYGLVHGAGLAYYTVVSVAYLAFLALIVAVAALFITAVMAYVPGARLKQWLMILGLVMGLGLVFGSQLVATGLGDEHNALGLLRRVGDLKLGGFPLLPHIWLARTAEGALLGRGTGFLLIALGAAVVASSALIFLASRVYVIGWASGQETHRRRGGRAVRRRREADLTGRSAFADPFWAVLRKDLIINLRTPVQWYLVVVGIIIVAFQLTNMARSFTGIVSESTRLLVVAIVLVGASFGGSVNAGAALSREGHNLQLVRSWPVSPVGLLAGKIAAVLPVPMVVAVGALAAFARLTSLGLSPIWRYIPVLLLTAVPTLSLMACLDTFFPDFRYERGFEPGTRGSASAVIKTLVSLYGGMAIIMLLVATLNLPSFYGRFAWARNIPAPQVRLAAYLLYGLECAGFTLGGLAIGARRLVGLTGRSLRES